MPGNDLDADLLQLAPYRQRVLEIGCGEGRFAAAYKARSPLCHYVGQEADPAAAALAAPHVDRLITTDFETADDAEIRDGAAFDLILMGDALGQMQDPVAALMKARHLLAPEGHLAISVANIAHWSSIALLMRGEWPFERADLIDRGDLRFFTTESLGAVLKDAGFQLLKHRALKPSLDKEQAERWVPALADLAGRMGIDRQAFLDRGQTSRNIVVARPAGGSAIQPIHIAYAAMAPRFMDVRARMPAQHLRSIPEANVSYREKSVELPEVPAGTAKIFVIQRPGAPDHAAWQAAAGAALRQGWLVVTEYDDHPELVGKVLKWPPERHRWTHIKGAHAVQTSTEKLAAVFRDHNPDVMAFPNTAFGVTPPSARAPGPLRIFYGALNRGEFGAAVARSLGPVLKAHPDAIFDIVFDKAFFDALPTYRKSFHPGLDYQSYLDLIGRCDIALLPLAGDAFELFKSDLKFVECASMRTAVIASDAVYSDSVEDGRTGLIAPGLDDWAPALDRLLGDATLRAGLVENAYDYVRRERMFAAQIDKRLSWYRSLWADRDRLHAALLDRCPWLGQA